MRKKVSGNLGLFLQTCLCCLVIASGASGEKVLKTNTSIIIAVGPFVDFSDGVTPEIAMTVTNITCELYTETDAGSAPTRTAITLTAASGNNDMVHMTSDVAGFYSLELTNTQLNVLGRAMLSFTDADVMCPVFVQLLIVPANIFDSDVGGTDKLDVNVEEWNTTAVPSENTAGYPIVTIKDGTNTGEIDTASGTVLLTSATETQIDTIATDTTTDIPALIALSDGDILVTHATLDDAGNSLMPTYGGQPLGGATIRAYRSADWTALGAGAPLRAIAVSDDAGEFGFYLDALEYRITEDYPGKQTILTTLTVTE